MSLFDGYSRDQLRLAYAQAWAKHLARTPLAPLEAQIADVIEAHPEYQRIVADADTAVGFRTQYRRSRARIRFYIWGCISRFASNSPSTVPRGFAI